MKKVSLFIFFCLAACGSNTTTTNSNLPSANLTTQYSLERAKSCLNQNDLSCASENYCALKYQNPNDAKAGLSCCVSKFVEVLSNTNTKKIASYLGYNNLNFSDLRNQSTSALLANKKIIFGELFMKSDSQASRLQDLALQWGAPLLDDNIATEELNASFRQLGADIEEVNSCLASQEANVTSNVILEGLLVGMNQTLEVSPKDFRFAKFATGLLAYGFQSVFSYEWGFENFPSWPLSSQFYQDVNGQLSSIDERFGDLSSSGASRLVGKSNLLRSTFQDWNLFAQSSWNGSLIDRWIDWRLSSSDEQKYKNILTTVSTSISSGAPQVLVGESTILNFSSLLDEASLPKAANLSRSLVLLSTDFSGDPEVNWDYFEQLLQPLLQ